MAVNFDLTQKKQLYPNTWNTQSDPLASLKALQGTSMSATATLPKASSAWNPKTAGQSFITTTETPVTQTSTGKETTQQTSLSSTAPSSTTTPTPTSTSYESIYESIFDYQNQGNANVGTPDLATTYVNSWLKNNPDFYLWQNHGNGVQRRYTAAEQQRAIKTITDYYAAFLADKPASVNASNYQEWENKVKGSMQSLLDSLHIYGDQFDKQFDCQKTNLTNMNSEWEVAHSGDTYVDTMDWLVTYFQTGWNNESVVKPFESEWTAKFKTAFGDLAGSASSTDFLQTFLKGFGLDKIATDQVNWGDYGFQNYSPDALLKFLADGSNIPSWDSKTVEGADVKDEQSFIKFIMNAAKTMLPQLDKDVNLMSDILGQARGEQLRAALQLINQPGMTKEEYDAQLNGIMEPIRQAAESQKRGYEAQAGMVLAGASTKSLYMKRQVDNNVNVQQATVAGQLTATDIKMRQENMQYAITTLGSISQSEVDRLVQQANIAGTKNGQVLDFLAKVGQIAVGSKETEYTAYTNRLNAAQQLYLENADRTLREKLGIAGINLDLYKTQTGLDYDKVQLAYEVALKNRGMNSDEAKAQAASMIEQYKMAATFGQMDQDKLTKLAQLAAQAQNGDREAWGAYQSMILEENLKNRGMDIIQAQSLAELTYGMWKTDKETALTMWANKYNGQLQKDLTQMEIDGQPSPWLQAIGQLFGGLGAIAGYLKATPKT